MTPDDDLTATLLLLQQHDRKAFDRVKMLLSASEVRHGLDRPSVTPPQPLWQRRVLAVCPHFERFGARWVSLSAFGIVAAGVAMLLAWLGLAYTSPALSVAGIVLMLGVTISTFVVTPIVGVVEVWRIVRAWHEIND